MFRLPPLRLMEYLGERVCPFDLKLENSPNTTSHADGRIQYLIDLGRGRLTCQSRGRRRTRTKYFDGADDTSILKKGKSTLRVDSDKTRQ